ncbi:hypothetical protein WMF18_17165 [Sorangium sp. So ce315]|uniref:hypothetical protein n=1 Tax=Sorangium sp. So ce315 TaxID=3133299 RepID=UPI003F63175C
MRADEQRSPEIDDMRDVQTERVEHPSARSGDPSALSPEPGPAAPATLPSPRTSHEQSRTDRDALAVAVVAPPRLELAASGPAGAPGGSQVSLLEQITGALQTAAAQGDLDTARALHAALARALGVTPPAEASGARVVALRGRGKRDARS